LGLQALAHSDLYSRSDWSELPDLACNKADC
ncbi:MAG: hypothetical protein ACI814_005121, partial [Mariniblastus sp.]